jgi:ABC-type Fe3+ transport system permease subunit
MKKTSTSAQSRSHFDFTPSGADMDETAQSAISSLKKANDATNQLRSKAENSSAGQSSIGAGAPFLSSVIPAVTGMITNQAIGAAWKKATHTDHLPDARDRKSSLWQALGFAVISAVIGTLIARVTSVMLSPLTSGKHSRRHAR